MILGTMMVGQAVAFAPNYSKAKVAAARVFFMLERVPTIDASSDVGLRPVSWSRWITVVVLQSAQSYVLPASIDNVILVFLFFISTNARHIRGEYSEML